MTRTRIQRLMHWLGFGYHPSPEERKQEGMALLQMMNAVEGEPLSQEQLVEIVDKVIDDADTVVKPEEFHSFKTVTADDILRRVINKERIILGMKIDAMLKDINAAIDSRYIAGMTDEQIDDVLRVTVFAWAANKEDKTNA